MSCGKRSCNYKVSMTLSKREGSIEKSREIALIYKVSTMKQGGDGIQQLFISISAAQQKMSILLLSPIPNSHIFFVFLLLSLIHVNQNSIFCFNWNFWCQLGIFFFSILWGWKFSAYCPKTEALVESIPKLRFVQIFAPIKKNGINE